MYGYLDRAVAGGSMFLMANPVIVITEQPSTIKSKVTLLRVLFLHVSWKRMKGDEKKRLATSNHRDKS